MDNLQQLLQISAKLFQYLETAPKGDMRDGFIEEINRQLDVRGELINSLREEGFKFDNQNKLHSTLMQLDTGIRKRLESVMQEIKIDMKNLQNAKKNEEQYINPYASVRVMDGMYYDKKK